jgi:hypothetical protein
MSREEEVRRMVEYTWRRTVQTFQIAAICMVVAAGVYFWFGPGPASFFLSVAVFFLIATAFEFWTWTGWVRDSQRPIDEWFDEEGEGEPTADFELVDRDGEFYYLRRVAYEDGVVTFLVSDRREVTIQGIANSNRIIAGLAEFTRLLYEYVNEEKERFPELAYELENLKLHTINYLVSPESAEVSFKQSISGRLWGCAYEDGRFYNLSFDG